MLSLLRTRGLSSISQTALRASNQSILANVRPLAPVRAFTQCAPLNERPYGLRRNDGPGPGARGGSGGRPMNRGGDRRGGDRRGGSGGYSSGNAYEAASKSDFPRNSMEVVPKHTKFQELADSGSISPQIISTVTEGMGHQTMTDVQAKTVEAIIGGRDIAAQAKTGTGKTLGFLLPIVERILRTDPKLANPPAKIRSWNDRSSSSVDIRSIIISPTRELAEQIAVEARKVTRNTSLRVQTAVGGVGKQWALKQLQREGCHILVGTPGRLRDILSDPYSGVKVPNLTNLTLDEGDRLLDAGFSREIQDIIQLLPDPAQVDRQTLIFSATIPKEVTKLVHSTLKPDFGFVQTVDENEVPTHEKITQHVVALRGLENAVPTIVQLAKQELEAEKEGGKPFKAIVYFNSSAEVELFSQIFHNLASFIRPVRPIEIAGSLTQGARTKAADNFRTARNAILFSTDVTARGMHFPGVSHVIQFGVPPNGEQYVHRLGRTGRGDETGQGWLFIADFEMMAAQKILRGLPIKQNDALTAADVDMATPETMPEELKEVFEQVKQASARADVGLKVATYTGTLRNRSGRCDGRQLVPSLNRFAEYGLGLQAPPPISPRLARELGNHPGLNVSHERAQRTSGAGYGDAGGRSNYGERSFGGDRRGGGDRQRGGGYERRERSQARSDFY